jgi:hypothetical protein
MVHNSRMLGVFDEIIHDPQCNLRAVEIAGRGIAGGVRCALAVIAGKSRRFDDPPVVARRRVLAHADRLMELIAIEDDLIEVWRCWLAEGSDDATFERMLNDIVLRLEAWPQHLDRDDIVE